MLQHFLAMEINKIKNIKFTEQVLKDAKVEFTIKVNCKLQRVLTTTDIFCVNSDA